MPEPSDADERRSIARIEELRAALLAEADEALRARPGVRVVGFVIEPDAPEGILVRQLLPPRGRQTTGGFAGVVERAIAIRILGVVAPALLDWIDVDEDGPDRGLPVVYLARAGMRTAVLKWLAAG